MRDSHSHYSTDNTGYCAHCGQALAGASGAYMSGYGDKRVNHAGLAVTVLVHLLVVLLFIFKQNEEKTAAPPSGGAVTYIAPLPGKPKQKEAVKAEEKPVEKTKPVKATVARIERLPDTITLPNEKPVEVVEEPPKEVVKKEEPTESFADMLAAKRRARGQDTQQQQGEESEDDRGNRIARENIARANGRSSGDDRNDTGGVFSVANQSFSSAELKFRGWNPSFKRRWLQQVTVELGSERDIETAIVKKMIELIRKEKTGDFDWDSHRLGRVVKMSARPQDQAELEQFLFKEMFPAYRPPRGG